MADTPPVVPSTPAPPDPTPPAPAPKPNETEGRISALVTKNKELEDKIAAREAADKAAEDDKAKKKGDYEKLIKDREEELAKIKGEHGTTTQKVEAYEKVLKAQVEKQLAAVTDEKKKATVEKLLAGKSLAEQFDLLPELLETIGVAAPGGFGGATPAGGTTPSATELATKQKRYAELLTKPNETPAERAERNALMKELEPVWQAKQQSSK